MSPHSDCLGAAGIPRVEPNGFDALMLQGTLDLAELGRAGARPNPVVGAVLATPDGRILATGHHARRGEAHAERACLDSFPGEIPEDATLYVSLEPCSHHGRTPPCADLIIERGVRRVVQASSDPNPITCGRGPARLTAAGVEVLRGPVDLERRALQQNAGFHSVHLRGRPYVTAKWAMTENGRFATGDPDRRWISNERSRQVVQFLRAGSGAVACGIGTALADDPLLNVRGETAGHVSVAPVRVVYDRTLQLPLESQLVRTVEEAPVLVVCAHDAPVERATALREAGVEVWFAPEPVPGAPCLLAASLAMLAERGVNDLLLEAGPTLLDAFADADLIDAAIAFVAPISAPAGEPGLAMAHPLVAAALGVEPQSIDGDALHHAVLHPVWDLPGASAD